MLKRLFYCFIICLAAALLSVPSLAQSTTDSTGSNISTPVYADIENSFYQKIGPQSRLYNGFKYEFSDPSIKGNAFFDDINTWSIGNIMYDGYQYSNVNIMYDIFSDILIVMYYNKFMKISLVPEKVQSFDMAGHHFIRIQNDPVKQVTLKTGYYDDIYDGKIQVLVKKSKSTQTQNGMTGDIITYFSLSVNNYLYKDGKYYTVNSQGAFLDALQDHKKEVKQFISKNKIKFKKSPEESMVAIAAYYDHLTN